MGRAWSVSLLLLVLLGAGLPAAGQVLPAPTIGPEPQAAAPAELDGLAWTVVRTPPDQRVQLPAIERGRNLLTGRIRPLPDRRLPPVFWYASGGLRYAVVHHRGPAPLVVLIPGTGGSFDSVTSQQAARVFYAAGFHVLGLPSPTHPDFIINASSAGVPGRPEQDAADLYRAIQLALAAARERGVEVSSVSLAGYSLGALNAAYLARLDQQEHAIGFRRTLLLNPPVSVWNSVGILDGMFARHVPNDPAKARQLIDRIFEQFARVYTQAEGTTLDADFLYSAYNALEPSSDALETLIGVTFRLANVNLMFTSDVMSRSGYMVPADAELGSTTSLTPFLGHLIGKSFTDYVNGIYVPHFQAQDPGFTMSAAIAEASLKPIEGFLRSDPGLAVVTNHDDIILAPGELDWLVDVFGARAVVLRSGGHLGNYLRRDFVDTVTRLLRS
jgi:predicted esterase